jgi:hypothetical protein
MDVVKRAETLGPLPYAHALLQIAENESFDATVRIEAAETRERVLRRQRQIAVLEGTAAFDYEDGGMAMIGELIAANDFGQAIGPDHCLFVRIQSYDEERVGAAILAARQAGQEYPTKSVMARVGHPLANAMQGKRIRVTIEYIEDLV